MGIDALIGLGVAVIIYILGINTNRPKLIVAGGGGGGGGAPDSVHHTNIAIMNDPSFFGMKLDRKTAKIIQPKVSRIREILGF